MFDSGPIGAIVQDTSLSTYSLSEAVVPALFKVLKAADADAGRIRIALALAAIENAKIERAHEKFWSRPKAPKRHDLTSGF